MAVRFSTIHRWDFLPSVNPPSESFRCYVLAIQTSLIAFDLIAALYLPRSDDKTVHRVSDVQTLTTNECKE